MKSEPAKTTKNNITLINNINMTSVRLSLKKFTQDEVEFNVVHELNPQLMQYIRDPLPEKETRQRTVDKAIDWCGEEKEWVLIAVYHLNSNDYMGLVCFRYESIENDTVEIGWRLGEEFHGSGYATEASLCLLDFVKANIKPHKVVAYCIADNTASSNIMSKLGMQKEAHMREFCKLGGQWFDEAIYGLILDND